MNYISGLMLGASIANMLRQSLGSADSHTNESSVQGAGGGRGRSASGFSSAAGGLALGGAALTGLLGGGRMGGGASLLSTGLLGGGRGGASSPLTSLFSTMGRAGGAQPFLSGGGGGRMGRQSAQEEASAPVQQQAKVTAEPPFTCVHASPGRRRYRTPYLTKEFAAVLEECLARLPFVLSVRANAVSGSILLTYLPEDEAHIVVLAEGLQAIFSEGRTAPPPATLAQSVRRSVHDFSGWIQRHTGGALDLSSVVAGIFVLRGIRQLVLTNNTPSGSQMLWWALTLMRGWKV